jgi:hypothetical protein
MAGRQLVYEDFADKVEQIPAIPLTLAEAGTIDMAAGRPDIRPPFSLTFLAKDPRVLPQRIYRMQHDDLGLLEIFLVPMAKDACGATYQAAFN